MTAPASPAMTDTVAWAVKGPTGKLGKYPELFKTKMAAEIRAADENIFRKGHTVAKVRVRISEVPND